MPAEIHLSVEGSDADETERLRQAIASEVSTRVVVAPGGSARVLVRRRAGYVVVQFVGPDGKPLTRDVSLPPDPAQAREAIVLLVGNLVRDEAADLEASLRPPPAASSAPSPALPASAPAASSSAPVASSAPAVAPPASSPPPSGYSIQHPPERPWSCSGAGPLYPVAVEAVGGLTAPPGAAKPGSERWLSLSLIGQGGGATKGLSLGLLGEYGRPSICGFQMAPLLAHAQDVTGAQLATFTAADRVRGWQQGVIALTDSLDGVQTGVLLASRRVRGAQFGTLPMTWSMHGLQVGAVTLAGALDGAQLGAINLAGPTTGAQLGAVNLATRFSGLQLGSVNVAGEAHGVQLGSANLARESHGLQLGTVNAAWRAKGVQLGLINVASESENPIGLINVILRGRTHVDVSALDYPGAAVSLVHGGKHTHSIHGVGVRWTRDGAARFVAMTGLGAYWHFSESVFGEVDALAHYLPGAGFRRNASAYQLRMLAGLQLTPTLAVFAGPTVTVSVNQLADDEHFALQPSWTLTRSDHTPTVVRLWPGLTAGVRLFLALFVARAIDYPVLWMIHMTPADRLERTQWDLFWLPPDAVAAVDRPDLLLVTCRRPVPFLNVVLRARCAPADALALVDEAASHPSLARWVVTDTFDRAPLESALTLRGWAPGPPMEVRVLDVDTWHRAPSMTVRRVDARASLLDAIRVTDRAFDQNSQSTEESLAADLRQCTDGDRVHRFVVYDDHGDPVSSGGLTSFPSLQMGLLWAGGTVAEARGHGAYTALLAARIACARALGLRWVGLYARAATSAPIVARHGFAKHGEMHYWERTTEL